MFCSTKRQQFLADHGYTFKVITHPEGTGDIPGLVDRSRDEQIELLSFMLANDSEHEVRTDVRDEGHLADAVTSKSFGSPSNTQDTQRMMGSRAVFSVGGRYMTCVKQSKSTDNQPARTAGSAPRCHQAL